MSNDKSRLRKSVEEIPDHKLELHRSLVSISMNVSKGLRNSDMTKVELEKEIDRHDEDNPGEYIDRLFAGGINLTLRTIFKLEEALDMDLIETKEHEPDDPDNKRRRREE